MCRSHRSISHVRSRRPVLSSNSTLSGTTIAARPPGFSARTMCSTKASCLLDVSAVMEKSERVGRPPPFFVPNGGLVRTRSALIESLAIGRQRINVGNSALDAVQQQVHQAEAMRIGHQFGPDKGIVPLEKSLRLGQLVEIVGLILDVAVGGDEKARRAGGRVLHDLARLRLSSGGRCSRSAGAA